MTSPYDWSAEQCQPCAMFVQGNLGGSTSHTDLCPACEGSISPCLSCGRFHHTGGWNVCGIHPDPPDCNHPACLARGKEGKT
jgi:hypothetical protein